MSHPEGPHPTVCDVESRIASSTGVRIRIVHPDGSIPGPLDPLPDDTALAEQYAADAWSRFPLLPMARVQDAHTVLRWWLGCELVILDRSGSRAENPNELLARCYEPAGIDRINSLVRVRGLERRTLLTRPDPRAASQAPAESAQHARPASESPYLGTDPFLFLSRAKLDDSLIEPFRQGLISSGVRLWWDHGIGAGQDFSKVIEERLHGSAATIVALAKTSLSDKPSQWVLSEAEHSVELLHPLLPVRFDDTPLPLRWRALVGHCHILDARPAELQQAVRSIVARASELGALAR